VNCSYVDYSCRFLQRINEYKSNYLGPFRNRFPLNLYRKLPLVNSLSLNQLKTVFKIIVPLEDRETLCSEFFDYQTLDSGLVPAYEIGDRVDAFWAAIQRLKDSATGKQLYPIKFVQARHACPSNTSQQQFL
jgi:hypothetical protein